MEMEIRCSNCEYSKRGCSDVPCSKCTQYDLFTPKKIQTNAEHIRAMSDEELADFIPIVSNLFCKPTDDCMKMICNRGECEKTKDCALNWLKSLATD